MTKGLILSGGWGTRLRPLTCTIPKTLIPIVNRPVMERQILKLKEAGVKEIILAVSVMSDIVKNYFKDGEKLGIKIYYTNEKFPAGTAGALKLAESYLSDENFFMLNGDVIFNFDFRKMLEFHERKGGIGTIASKLVNDPSRYGVLITDDLSNKVLKFLEKEEYVPPKEGPKPMPINAGVYLLEPEILSYIEPNKKVSIEREVFPKVAREKDLFHYPIEGVWKDIGKPEELLNGNILLLKELIKNKATSEKNLISDSVQIDPTVTIISPCAIGEKVIIGKNCTIGPNAIIGDNVYIEDNVKISNCIVYNESYISQNANIDTAIIADNCLIEEGVILKGNGENLIILASYVSVRKNIKLIATDKSSITFCHHELIKDDIF